MTIPSVRQTHRVKHCLILFNYQTSFVKGGIGSDVTNQWNPSINVGRLLSIVSFFSSCQKRVKEAALLTVCDVPACFSYSSARSSRAFHFCRDVRLLQQNLSLSPILWRWAGRVFHPKR